MGAGEPTVGLDGVGGACDADAGGECGGSVDADSKAACVVCLTDPRSTSLMPCRHMCVCHECAQVLVLRCWMNMHEQADV